MADGATAPDEAFEAWYRREHPRVVAALAVAGGSVEVAREATDEAFVRAYERWPRVRAMDSPGGWLYRVALNELRRRFRRQAIERELLRRHRDPEPDGGPPPIADPTVWAAVRELPRRQRSAVALRYVLDLTEREVAATMGISRGAASASLTSARRTLHEVLADGLDDLAGPVDPDAGPVEPGRTDGEDRRAVVGKAAVVPAGCRGTDTDTERSGTDG